MGLKVWLVSRRKDIFNIVELLIILTLIPITYTDRMAYKESIEECWATTGILGGVVTTQAPNLTTLFQNVTLNSSDTIDNIDVNNINVHNIQ